MTGLALASILALGGCRTAGSSMREGDTVHKPTDSAKVVVLDAPPHDAVKIGSVEGYVGGTFGSSALGDAKDLAADMGADAIVLTGTGKGTINQGLIGSLTVPTVRADAYRLSK